MRYTYVVAIIWYKEDVHVLGYRTWLNLETYTVTHEWRQQLRPSSVAGQNRSAPIRYALDRKSFWVTADENNRANVHLSIPGTHVLFEACLYPAIAVSDEETRLEVQFAKHIFGQGWCWTDGLERIPWSPTSTEYYGTLIEDGIIARSQSRREILAQFPLTGYISPKQPGNLECKNSEAPLVFAWDCGGYRDEMHVANQEVHVSMIRRQTSTMQPKQVHAGTRVYNSISRQFTC